MKDKLYLSSTPTYEDCAQVGSKEYDYREQALIGITAYIAQLKRLFPNEKYQGNIRCSANSHDFGTYYEVVVWFDDQDEDSMRYAFRVENNSPEFWDSEAKAFLESKGYKIPIADSSKKAALDS